MKISLKHTRPYRSLKIFECHKIWSVGCILCTRTLAGHILDSFLFRFLWFLSWSCGVLSLALVLMSCSKMTPAHHFPANNDSSSQMMSPYKRNARKIRGYSQNLQTDAENRNWWRKEDFIFSRNKLHKVSCSQPRGFKEKYWIINYQFMIREEFAFLEN